MVSKIISYVFGGRQTTYWPEEHTIKVGRRSYRRLTAEPQPGVEDHYQFLADATTKEKDKAVYPVRWISFQNQPGAPSKDTDVWFSQAYQESRTTVTALKADIQVPLNYNHNCDFSVKPAGEGAFQLINMGIGGFLMVDGSQVCVKPVATSKDHHDTFNWLDDKYLKVADADIYLMRDESTDKIVITSELPKQICLLQPPTQNR